MPSGRRWLVLVIGSALLGAVAWQAPPVQGAGGPGLTVERSVLPSGLILVTERRTESRVAGIAIAVRAGSRYEEERTDSAAHLLEHMYFQGTVGRPSRDDLSKPIAAVGGSLSVEAGWELLRFESSVRATDLDLAVDVLSDMLQRSLFDPDKLDKERGIVLQELADIHDDPAQLLSQTVQGELFAGQALSHLPSGSADGVEQLSAVDLAAFRDRWVGANRTVIAVVSPYEHADLAARIERAFAGFGPAAASEASKIDLGAARTGRIDVAAGSEQSQVAVAAPVAGLASADRYPLAVLQASLNGFTGRLVSEIREQRGLAYQASARLRLTSDSGLLAVMAGTEPKNAEVVLGLLQDELAHLRETPLAEAELARAIGMVRGGRLVGTEAALARADDLATNSALGIDEPIEAFEARVGAVTAADVQRVAQTYFGPEHQLDVVVKP